MAKRQTAEYYREYRKRRLAADPDYEKKIRQKNREWAKRKRQTPEWKATVKAYRQRPDVVARRRVLASRPQALAKAREYMKRKRATDASYVERTKQRRREYMKRPEVRERYRNHDRKRWASGDKGAAMWMWQLGARYGLSLDKYHAMRESQGELCAICGLYSEKLRVDHDHDTGKVRALLCPTCNSGIGLLKDDPKVLVAAAHYIEAHRVG